ncbi:hypothetical protein LJC61_07155 [Ruminococcaceae bacterium OttesenSCG-928-A16]|nr:hypothetical protein [Ruminococcaceae bacterium OttesenSCG-928-A16]
MRKLPLLLLSLIVAVLVAACSRQSALRQATGVTANQESAIMGALEENGVEFELINEANHNKPNITLPQGYTIYNLIDKNGNNHFLVLTASKDFAALLDSNGTLMHGSLA